MGSKVSSFKQGTRRTFDTDKMMKIFLWILVVSLMMLSYVEADCHPGYKKGDCKVWEKCKSDEACEEGFKCTSNMFTTGRSTGRCYPEGLIALMKGLSQLSYLWSKLSG